MRRSRADEICFQPAARLIRMFVREQDRFVIQAIDTIVRRADRVHRNPQSGFYRHPLGVDVDAVVTAVLVHL